MARICARSASTGSFHCALAVGAGWPRRLLAASPVLIGVAGGLAVAVGMIGEIAARVRELAGPVGAIAGPGDAVAAAQGSAIGGPGGVVSVIAVMLVAFAVAVAVAIIAWRCRVRNLPASPTDRLIAESGLLRIAADGHIWWQADGRRASQPLQPLRWYVGRRVTWIHASVSPGTARLQLLLWRTSADDAAWRKLQAWLVWRERGGSRT